VSDLQVGCAGFPVDPDEYAGQLGFVEMTGSFDRPPSIEEASALTRRAPGGLAVGLVCWQVVTHPKAHPAYRADGGEIPDHAAIGHFARSRWTDEAWERMDTLARAIRSPVVLLRTPPSFRKTAANALAIENFVAHAERPGLSLAWEWGPTWPEAAALTLCERLDLIPSGTTTAIPASDRVYLRVASGRRATTEAGLEKVAKSVRGRQGYVVFESPTAWEDARRFAKLL
jgi:uncharacterized protein YecE (DUF72 family)